MPRRIHVIQRMHLACCGPPTAKASTGDAHRPPPALHVADRVARLFPPPAVLISYQLLPTAAEKHAIYKNGVHGVIVCLAIFNLLWLMGSEGSASLGLSQEVGIYVIVDVILKTGLGLYIVLQYGAFRNPFSLNTSSLPSPFFWSLALL